MGKTCSKNNFCLTSIDVIKSSMSEIAASAQNLKEALGSEVTSGLMTQIDAMLAKKDELQNLANILKSNKEDLNKAAKATGNKKNAVSEEYYSKNYQKMYESGISELKKKYPDSDIVGPQIRQLDDGMVKFSASIRSANGEWQKLSATMTKDGNLLYQNPKGMTQTASASAEKAYQNIKAGKLDPKDFLNFDQTEAYAQKLNQIFEEAYGKTDKYTAKVEADGQAVISKALPSGEEVTVMQAKIDDVKQIMSEYEQVAGDAVKVKEFVEKNVSSISAKVSSVSKKSANSTSSSTSIKTTKYVTDQSYVGDYKTLADNEAFARTLDTFRHNTTEANAAIEERNKIMARVNAKTPQNTAETNAKQRFDDIDKTITDNFSKYGDRIQSAYNAFDKIKADKSGIAGIGDVFKSSEEQINKWATAVAKGKMGISEFEKKVSGLSGSVGSIGKIIDPASITDAKGELESYLRELTNVQDITFSGFTEKNGIVSLKGTFKDSAGEAQTLSVQLNTLNGQINCKDWIIMDCYGGNDVGGSVALGVNRQKLAAYIMRSAAERSSWAESAELLHTLNYTSYTVTKTGSGASGTWGISISGNATTSTKLATARSINGTNFDGSGNITTATWGTARTLTIGNTGKSVNGGGNVSWSLSEIGAAASNHTHSYLPLSGGAMTGNISYRGSKATYKMIEFIDNSSDEYGNGIAIGGGGLTIIGGGESADVVKSTSTRGGDERLILANDGAIDIYTNCQNGIDKATHITIDNTGLYSGTAAKANSVPWSGVTGKPSTYTPSSHNHTVIQGTSSTSAVPGKANDGFCEFYYNVNNGLANNMPSSNNANAIISISRHAGDYTSQLGFSSNGNLYYREGVGATAWKTILTSSNYTSYTVTKTGGGASGTWGINITGSAGSCTGNAATASNASKVNGHTVNSDVPSGAKFTDTNTWRPLGTAANTACAGNDSRLSNARPASDVYSWAKASSKPSYSWSEITSKPSTFTPASHTHAYIPLSGGTITGSIIRSSGGSWISARNNVAVRGTATGKDSWNPVVGQATPNGYWTIGNLASNDNLAFSYTSNTNYNAGNNSATTVYLPVQEGTIITSATIGSQSVKYATSAGSAGSVAWGNVSGKPSSYTPSSHTHDDRYYTETEINTKLGAKLGAVSANGYYGMTRPDGNTSDWIRTTTAGIIPYQSGGAGGGHCGIGTSSWYFSNAYIDTVNCVNTNASGYLQANGLINTYSEYQSQKGNRDWRFGSATGNGDQNWFGFYDYTYGFHGGWYGPDHIFRAYGELQSTSANSFRSVYGNYGFIIRNDGANIYFMMTKSGDPYGIWNDNYTIFTPNGEWQIKKSPYDNGMSTSRGYVVVSDSNADRVYSISNNANYLKVRGGLNTYHCTYSNSDIRLKKNINNTSITNALSVINSIKVRQFDWKETNIHQSIGFVADELEKLDPNFSQGGGVTKDGGIDVKSVNSFYLQGYIVKALQELSSQVSDLKQENKRLKQKLNMCN